MSTPSIEWPLKYKELSSEARFSMIKEASDVEWIRVGSSWYLRSNSLVARLVKWYKGWRAITWEAVHYA